jgi:hypothetical protein
MNQLPNLPKSPQQIENLYKQGLVNLGYDRKNLPPLWVYNLYEALKPNGKKLNDSSLPYFQETQQGMLDAVADIKAQSLVGPNGKQMTVIEYIEMVYGKKDRSNSSSQMPPLSPSMQAIKNLPKPPAQPTSLEDKLAELRNNMPVPNPSSQPWLYYGNSSLQDKLADLKAADLAQNPPSPKLPSSPSPYRGPRMN